ncbi:uncharacterized protein JCM10292_002136 [Rhodotorula paludigena]|uniref:uncharacterized protein n=1 Tax=Rhodotorula paludigena TaxID=86838 RepID=UPI003175DE60
MPAQQLDKAIQRIRRFTSSHFPQPGSHTELPLLDELCFRVAELSDRIEMAHEAFEREIPYAVIAWNETR